MSSNLIPAIFVHTYRPKGQTVITPRVSMEGSEEKTMSMSSRHHIATPLQTKNHDIFPVYSASRQYVREYAGNIPAIVPNSLDSYYSQSNNRSTSIISRIYRSPYIREESYMFEYTDTVSGSHDTRYREYTVFFCREYIC